jgi:hypothetical protein
MVAVGQRPNISTRDRSTRPSNEGTGAAATVANGAQGAGVGGQVQRGLRVDVFEKAQGATRAKVTDLSQGRLKNGRPVGKPIVRVDKPHGKVNFHHLNVENLPKPLKGLEQFNHAKIPQVPTGALKVAKHGGKALIVVGAVADVIDIKQSHALDKARGDANYSETKKAVGRTAGGWSGAVGGAAGGAAIGTAIFPGVGTAVGGIIGGIAGSIGGSAVGNWLGSLF